MRDFFGDFNLKHFEINRVQCQKCFEWVLLAGGDKFSALTSAGVALWYEDDRDQPGHWIARVEKARVSTTHHCDPIRLEAVKIANAEIAKAFAKEVLRYGYSEETLPQWITRQGRSREIYDRRLAEAEEVVTKKALGVRCPKCGAVAGAKCENLTSRKRGKLSFTKNLHAERIDASGGRTAYDDADLKAAFHEYTEISNQVRAFVNMHQEYKGYKKAHNQALVNLKAEQVAKRVYEMMEAKIGESKSSPLPRNATCSPWPSDDSLSSWN